MDEADLDRCQEFVEDEAGVVYDSLEDYYKAMGLDHRRFDSTLCCLREEDTSWRKAQPPVYVRRATFDQPLRIEALRWKAYLAYSEIMNRRTLLAKEIWNLPDHECFIAPDPEDVRRWKETGQTSRGDDLTEEEIIYYSRPRRIVASNEGDGTWATYDDRFWDYDPPKIDKKVAMEVLAAAHHHGVWETTTLREQEQRAADPVKLAFGARYRHLSLREQHLSDKCYLLNRWLEVAVVNTEIIPKCKSRHPRLVKVWMNGRLYFFKVSSFNKQAEHTLWPFPNDLDEIHVEPADTVC